ncbi:MAG: leucine-rich repeat protein, partial [Clostridia bacterium]|nr:leucine-rich repeat protein [Clostridia bacterium]
ALIAALWLGTALAETRTITVTGKYGQTEARRMLEMINDFRTGSDAWYRSSDNGRIDCEGLVPLLYDSGLEKVAMQRAIEIAVRYPTETDKIKHMRPNGEKWLTAYTLAGKDYSYMGENIAAAYDSAASVFASWQETNEDYEGQGHRRNMLSDNFNCVGIAYVEFNGFRFWVQEFGWSSHPASDAAALDSYKNMEVQIDLAFVESVEPDAGGGLELRYEGETDLPYGAWVKLDGTWLGRAFMLETMPGWSVANGDIAAISGNALKGVAVGQTQLSATVLGKALTVPVTVRPADLTTATVKLSETSFVYTGDPKTPQATVELNGKRLEAGRDYTLTYAANVDAGTGTVVVTGANNYENTVSVPFTIARADLSGATADALPDVVYAGASYTPELALSWNGRRLVAGQEYALSYEDNLNAGTARVTATGVGNFTGTFQATFAIAPAPISTAQLEPIADRIYTGEAIEPELVMTLGGRLTGGVDFSAAYANNTNVGAAGITITGMGNFTGAVEAGFNIVPADLGAAAIDRIAAVNYTGGPLTPQVRATLRGRELVRDVDYTLSWRNNTDVTKNAVAVVSGIGNYAGTKERTFEIRLAKGTTFAMDSGRYRYESNGTATFLSAAAGVKALKIPDTIALGSKRIKVAAVADKACYGKRDITGVTLGKYVQTVGKSAFSGCAKLKTLKGGAGLTTLKDYAFSGCTALGSVTLESSVKKVGKNAFKGCKSLKTIVLKTAKLSGSTVGANAFKGISGKAVFTCPKKKLKSYEALLRKRGAPKTAKFK